MANEMYCEIKCPICGQITNEDWPVLVDDEVEFGGCQTCAEKQCDESWWDMVMAISQIMLRPKQRG